MSIYLARTSLLASSRCGLHAMDGALVWRRVKGSEGERVQCREERFRPWLFAATLKDLKQLGPALLVGDAPGASNGLVSYRVLDGPADSYRYLLSARYCQLIERMEELTKKKDEGRKRSRRRGVDHAALCRIFCFGYLIPGLESSL